MYADMWHTQHGSLEKIQASDAVLRAHCAAVGRDPATIERLASKWVTQSETTLKKPGRNWRRRYATMDWRDTSHRSWILAAGTPTAVAQALQAHIDAGFTHLLFSLRAPFDHETIERMPEVRRLLTTHGN